MRRTNEHAIRQRFSRWGVALVACLALPAYGGMESVLEELRTQVISTQPYALGAELALELPMGKAARLEVRENAFGLKEILLYPKDDVLYHYCLWTNGQSSGGGRKLKEGMAFSTHNPAPSLGFVLEWEVTEGTVRIHYHTTTDEQDILRIKEKKRARGALLAKESAAQAAAATLSQDERVAGFARLWSEAKYNFVGFDKVPELDWDGVLAEYLPRVEKAEQVDAYYRVLQGCLAKLKDGHTGIALNWPRACPPFWVACVDGGAVVTEVLPEPEIELLPEAAKAEIRNARVRIGDEVTRIDGRDVAEVLKTDIYPIISASTAQERDFKAFDCLLRGDVDSRAVLEIKGLDGTTRQVEVGLSLYRRQPKARFEHRALENGLHYVAIRSFEEESVGKEFEALCRELRDSKGLIIDVRENGGGNSAFGDAVVARLIDAPVENVKWSTRQYIPAQRAWGQAEKAYVGEPETIAPASGATFAGPVVVLIGAGTMSAAENFVVTLHAAKRATLVGERSTGSTGQPLIVKLPGGGGARICTKRDTYPDGREFVGVGVIPDVEAHSTQADIAAGRDVVFEKGVEVLQGMTSTR